VLLVRQFLLLTYFLASREHLLTSGEMRSSCIPLLWRKSRCRLSSWQHKQNGDDDDDDYEGKMRNCDK